MNDSRSGSIQILLPRDQHITYADDDNMCINHYDTRND